MLIIDDNSDDGTTVIAKKLSAARETVSFLQRTPDRSRQAKGDVLNHGFSYLCARFQNRDRKNWLIGVFDADGRAVEDDLFAEVRRAFVDPAVAATQCGVRIRNGHNLLAALQDVEFATFSYIPQTVRDRISGAVALGGNGQFIRASVLDRLNEEGDCWDTRALTEDLDIAIRIHLCGGRIKFMDRWVEQEGVESFGALIKQRVRWAWGTLQVFIELCLSGRIMKARIPLGKKLELQYYLSVWILPVLVLFCFVASLLDLAGVLHISNSFSLLLLLITTFCFVPMMALGLIRARFSLFKIMYLLPLMIIYSYHWIPAVMMGLACVLTRREPQWAKTQRYTIESVEEVIHTAKEVVG